jgi:ATP/maltotriose-dependent transcriptional regulator MalT
MGLAHLPATGILHLVMGEVLLERNDLAGAEAQLSYGMELGKWSGRLDAARNAAPALVRLRQARGDDEGALAAIQAAQTALASRRLRWPWPNCWRSGQGHGSPGAVEQATGA